jgi:hypothetical protein
MYWMKTKTKGQYPAAFQKVSILLLVIDTILIHE